MTAAMEPSVTGLSDDLLKNNSTFFSYFNAKFKASGNEPIPKEFVEALSAAGHDISKLRNVPIKDEDGDKTEEYEDLERVLKKCGLPSATNKAIKKTFRKAMSKLKSYDPELEAQLKKALKTLVDDTVSEDLAKLQKKKTELDGEMAKSTQSMATLFSAVAKADKEFTSKILPMLHKGCAEMADAYRLHTQANLSSLALCEDLQGEDGKSGSLAWMEKALGIGTRSPSIDKQVAAYQKATGKRIEMMIKNMDFVCKKWKIAEDIFRQAHADVSEMVGLIAAKKTKFEDQRHATELELAATERQKKDLEMRAAELKKGGGIFGTFLNLAGALLPIPGLGKLGDQLLGGLNMGDDSAAQKEIQSTNTRIAEVKKSLDDQKEKSAECDNTINGLTNTGNGCIALAVICEEQRGEMMAMKGRWERFDVTWKKLTDTIENATQEHGSEKIEALFKESGLLSEEFSRVNNEVTQIREASKLAIQKNGELKERLDDARKQLIGE